MVAGLTAVVAERASRNERESDALVSHTWEVQSALHELEAFTIVGLRGIRGFLITGQESYLESFRANHSRVGAELAQLRTLTAADIVQQGRLQQLEQLEVRQLEVQDGLLKTANELGLPAARQNFASGVSEAATNATLKLIEDMLEGEERLLQSRLATAAESRHRSQEMSI